MAWKSYGRTLIETMSVLALISILLTISLPNLQPLLDGNQRIQTNNQMAAALQHARSSAVFLRQVITLCSGQNDCSGKQRWRDQLLIFIDKNANGRLDDDEEVLHQAIINKDFSWHWNRTAGYVQFEADGSTRSLNGTLTLCKDNAPQSQIVISLSGRIRTEQARGKSRC
ncbi:GspH/FimT family pseudopilin [Pseudomonas sp. AA-38]|uniref:GspH/FimT family pseudopilin n=1 Tax=Pseudomonas sp. AA-38 TaxID=3028807 RepID=UPI0023F9E014|nr:GspH/FimT family pseudopilin [Pseudomonas sp. AA-38]